MLELTVGAGHPRRTLEIAPIQPSNAAATPILRVTVLDAGDWFAVGGALVGRGQPDLAALDRIALMPGYAWERHPVMAIAGLPFRSSLYAKLPVLVAECTDGTAVAVSFPVAVRSNGGTCPTWFHLQRRDGALVLEVVVPATWTTLRKRPEDYYHWRPTELVAHVSSAPPGPWHCQSVRVFSGASIEVALRAASDALLPSPASLDPQEQADRALRFLASVQDPQSGAFLEWKRRDRPGFLHGWFSLPTYNRLPGTLAVAARHEPSLRAMAESAARPLLHRAATIPAVEDGVVFHNSLRRNWRGSLRYFSHLGSGMAGYPGGQANAVLALAQRLQAGLGTATDEALLRASISWMLAQRGPDGRLPRAVALAREPQRTGLELGAHTRSDGGDAEAAHALLIAGGVCGETVWTGAALELLARVEQAFDDHGHLRGYLRDNREDEAEGVSHIAATRAHLQAGAVTGDSGYVRAAARHASHLAAWIRPAPITSLDTLVSSFGPRLAPCESLWAARALDEVAAATGADTFARAALACADALRADEHAFGWTEAHYQDESGALHAHSFECVYSAEAVLEWALGRGARLRAPAGVQPLHEQAAHTALGRLRERLAGADAASSHDADANCTSKHTSSRARDAGVAGDQRRRDADKVEPAA